MLGSLVWALGLTLLLEEGFALLWGVRGKRDLGLVALVNCITNPLVNVLYRLGRLNRSGLISTETLMAWLREE